MAQKKRRLTVLYPSQLYLRTLGHCRGTLRREVKREWPVSLDGVMDSIFLSTRCSGLLNMLCINVSVGEMERGVF